MPRYIDLGRGHQIARPDRGASCLNKLMECELFSMLLTIIRVVTTKDVWHDATGSRQRRGSNAK